MSPKMKRKKKLMALFLVIAIFASLAMMTVHADPPPHPYVYAYLRLNMTSAVSGTVYRTNTHYGGYNQSNSAHRDYLSAHYSDGSGWKKDKELLVGIGATVGDSPTSTRSTCLWRAELNPYGVLTKNCEAGGYVKKW